MKKAYREILESDSWLQSTFSFDWLGSASDNNNVWNVNSDGNFNNNNYNNDNNFGVRPTFHKT